MIKKENVSDVLALTPLQSGMLFHYLKDSGSDLHFVQLSIRLSGSVDLPLFEEAWNAVVAGNEMLRTVFRWEKISHPVQIILKESKLDFSFQDVHASGGNTDELLESVKQEDRRKGFDLEKVAFRITLVRTGAENYVLIISNHHILYDGWSNGIILKEFFEAYENRCAGKTVNPKTKTRFAGFIRAIQNLDAEAQKKYWAASLEGLESVTALPLATRANPEGEIKPYVELLDKETTAQIHAFTRANGITLAAVIYTSWGILLARSTGSHDVIFGVTVSGRKHKIAGIEEMVGMFINTIPLRMNFPGYSSIQNALQAVSEFVLGQAAFENTPLPDIAEYAGLKGRTKLFNTLVTLENYPLDKFTGGTGKLRIDSHSLFEITNYDFTLNITDDEQVALKIKYNTAVYDQDEIKRLCSYFKSIVMQVVGGASGLAAFDLVTTEEKKKLLHAFNDTASAYPRDTTINELFEEQAAKTPAAIALITEGKQFTYSELNERANQLAGYLRKMHALAPGELVLIRLPRNEWMLLTILAVLKSGAAYVPVDPEYPAERISYMTADCMSRLLIDEDEIELFNLKRSAYKKSNAPVVNKAGDLAYVMYTSGSTGYPKGVMIEHRSVLRLVKSNWFFDPEKYNRCLSTGSFSFDASTFELWGMLLNGGTVALFPNNALLDPAAIRELIREHRINIMWFTSAWFNQLVTAEISLFETLEAVLVGGDKLSPDHIRMLREKYSHLKMINGYGPTENTTFSCCYEITQVEKGARSIPIGKPISNSECYILDENENLQPVGAPGELYVGGDGLARGYMNNEVLTRERFVPHPFKEGERLYKTGDIATYLPDGNIIFERRADDQVKIRGYRIEPREIEHCLQEHPLINEVVVNVAGVDTDKLLYAYYVPAGETDAAELKKYLSAHLPEYMIPSGFIALDKIPLTANGKVDRKALPAPGKNEDADLAGARDDMDRSLAEIWSGILKMEPGKIGIDSDFFELGGHSLRATSLASKIHKVFDVRVPLAEIFKTPTIRQIADYIRNAGTENHSSIPPSPSRLYYRLSPGQKRLYILQELEQETISYNTPVLVRLGTNMDRRRLEDVFTVLIARHESLRTCFKLVDNEPVQQVQQTVDFSMSDHTCAAAELDALLQSFTRPFRLEEAPLLRAGYVRVPGDEDYLLLDMHHIITDGISQEVLKHELWRLYQGESLAPLRLQYKDYSEWINAASQQQQIRRQESFWKEQFSGELPVLNLPLDYVRPQVRSFEGSTVHFELSGAEYEQLQRINREYGLTTYMSLLTLVNIWLSRLSGQQDIIIGSPIAARRHPDLEQIIGMFVNTLALRNYPSGDKLFSSFAQEVKQRTFAAYENQEYAFEDLVDQLSLERDPARNPLFDVMLALQNQAEKTERESLIGFREKKDLEHIKRYTKFDLTIDAIEKSNSLSVSIDYSSRLFQPETIDRFIGFFRQLLQSVSFAPDQRLRDLDILGRAEQAYLLEELNHTQVGFPSGKTIHALFAEQVARTPQATALVCGSTRLSYRELDEQSSRLSSLLMDKGVGPDVIVGLLLERSAEMVIGILAVLKAGGAYLPIDPTYPASRISYMLNNSKARLLLVNNDAAAAATTADTASIETLNIASQELYAEHAPRCNTSVGPHHLAYVIYTSGSTGMPKGAMIEHRSLVNRLWWKQQTYPIGSGDCILQKTPYTFDVSVWELLLWSFTGARVLMLPPGAEKDPEQIVAAISSEQVTMLHFVPSMLKAFLRYVEEHDSVPALSSLKRVICSGEALGVPEADRFYELLTRAHGTSLVNLYGPTEATIDVSYYNCVASEPRMHVPIGKPIANTGLLVLNEYGQLQGIGLAGELYITGVGLGRGYLDNAALTAERFVAHAYVAGERMYKTGDLARWLSDGNIEYLGRMDDQVKVRGYRIELGEIENQLRSSDFVEDALVSVRKDKEGNSSLVAYIVPDAIHTYPVRNLVRMTENDSLSARSWYELPGGMPVFYINKRETDFMYREIMHEGGTYFKHGISLPENGCVFDVGANIGMFSVYVKMMYPGAKIHAFEPLDPICEVLKKNAGLYGEIEVHHCGISSAESTASFSYYPNATVLSGRYANREEEKKNVRSFLVQDITTEDETLIEEMLDEQLQVTEYSCRLVTLSQAIRESKTSFIDLLKIDVEKSELEVLEGIAAEDWQKIGQVVMEVHDMDDRLALVRALLERNGFSTVIDRDLETSDLYNIYAIHKTYAPATKAAAIQERTYYSPAAIETGLRSLLAAALPDYMVPSFFVLLDKIPVTANGKADRKSLPDPQVRRDRGYVAPGNEMEAMLLAIWAEVLCLDASGISVHVNFFETGGNSLSCIRVVSMLNNELKKNIPVVTMFRYPTISQMAEYLVSGGNENTVSVKQIDQKKRMTQASRIMLKNKQN